MCACPTAATQIHEDDGKTFELELTWLCEESGWQHGRVPEELFAEAERAAKATLEDSDMDDD
jgi:20S proteasome subunit alpha 7